MWFQNIIEKYDQIRTKAMGETKSEKKALNKKPSYNFTRIMSIDKKKNKQLKVKKNMRHGTIGGSADRAFQMKVPKLLDQGQETFTRTNPWAERKSYLSHLDRVRRAHIVELKNSRMRLINIADEVVEKKISAFQKAIEHEFNTFISSNESLQARLLTCQRIISNLRTTIQNYEINTTKDLIRGCGNMQAIDVYLMKPQNIKKKKNKPSSNLDYLNFMTDENLSMLSAGKNKTRVKSKRVNEFEEGFRVFQDLMMQNLKYLQGAPDTSNKECQVIDLQGIEKLEQAEQQKQKLVKDIQDMRRQIDDQIINFASKYQKQQVTFDNKEFDYQNKISKLEAKCDKLYSELTKVKQVLRIPYLYKKYQRANFSEFAHLEIKQFGKKKKHKKYNRSLSLTKSNKFDEDTDDKISNQTITQAQSFRKLIPATVREIC